MTDTAPPPVELNLNFDGPRNLLRIGMQRVIDSVRICISALEHKSPPRGMLPPDVIGGVLIAPPGSQTIPGATMAFQFAPPDPNADRIARAWIVESAIHHLLKSVHQMLEEAFILAQLVRKIAKPRKGKPFDGPWLDAVMRKATPEAIAFHKDNGLSGKFAELWRTVRAQPPDELAMRCADVLTLVAARNCLEHRYGVVGPEDVKGTDALAVRWRALRMVDDNGNEVRPGMYVEGLKIKPHEPRERLFKLGERVDFSVSDFTEICYALDHLGIHLMKHLHDAAVVAGIPAADEPPKTIVLGAKCEVRDNKPKEDT